MKPQADSGVAVASERDAIARALEGGFLDDLVGLWDPWGPYGCSEVPERNALARIDELLGREVSRSDVSSLRKRVRDGGRAESGWQLLCFGLTRRVNDRARGRR